MNCNNKIKRISRARRLAGEKGGLAGGQAKIRGDSNYYALLPREGAARRAIRSAIEQGRERVQQSLCTEFGWNDCSIQENGDILIVMNGSAIWASGNTLKTIGDYLR